MGTTATLIIIIIFIVGGIFFWSEISAFAGDFKGFIDNKERDEQVRVPKPVTGQTVCDLFITAEFRSTSAISGDIISHERILFTDGQRDKSITWSWDDCHPYQDSILNLAPLELLQERLNTLGLNTLEFFIPDSSPFDQKIILTYKLVDEKGLEKKLPIYQDVVYIHPSFITDFDFEQKLKFRDLPPKDYLLEIIPTEAHFDNQKTGQAYKKAITFS